MRFVIIAGTVANSNLNFTRISMRMPGVIHRAG